MRIVLIGQAAFGERVLAALLDKGENVVGVFCPQDPPGKPGALPALAQKSGVPVFQPRRMRDPEAFAQAQRLQPDLNVMAFVTDIVPRRFLELPGRGSIQYHPSLLPRHRGGSAINWAVVQGETRTGLTIFWPDKGIDTGPILLQRETEIGPDDTTGSLYFNKLFPMGVDALVEAVALVRAGTAPRVPQDESSATSEPLFTEERAVVDWSRPAGEVYNLIRGANPAPGAVTTFGSQRLKLYDSERVSTQPIGDPGTIVEIDSGGFVVAAGGGAIRVKRVAPAGSGKITAAEWVSAAGVAAGGRLGT